jgi:hypothetical protein
MAALDDLAFTFSPSRTWSASANKTGTDYNPVKNQGAIQAPTVQIKKSIANAAVGGGDMLVSKIYSIAGGGNTVIDLTSLTDVLERSGGSFARLKYVEFRLLSTADDATNGTAATSVTIGNAAADGNTLFMDAAADTFTLLNGDFIIWGTRQAAGKAVASGTKNVKILNNDGAVAAKVQVTLVGGTT